MDLEPTDFDRLMFFEHACKAAEAEYVKNPTDADVRISSSFLCFILF